MSDRSSKPISVTPCYWEMPAEEARLQMQAAASELHVRAADAHAEGMYLEAQSVRIEQLAKILSDEELIKMRDLFVAEGVIVVEEKLDMSSPGGDA